MVKLLNKIAKIFECIFIVFLFISATLIISGCSSYQFGDASKVYCAFATDEERVAIQAKLNEKGLKWGVDYCAAVDVVKILNEAQHE